MNEAVRVALLLCTHAAVACALLAGCKPASENNGRQAMLPPVTSASSGASVMRCDTTQWTSFPTSADAFAKVLSSKPRVIAVGETHARRGAPDVLTATERFGRSLLPVATAHGAKVLVVELLSPPSGCTTEVSAVASVQKPVVEQQDDQNQDRFIALGHRARELQVTPLVLEPSCDEFSSVRKAGPDGVAAMLELIAAHTRAKLERLVGKANPEDMIVAYGGAVHNNLGPGAPFAFGEQLKAVTGGRYVALDLIVPEYVADTDAWKKLPWYPCWPELAHNGVTLVQSAPGEFTLFLEAGLKRPTTTNSARANTTDSSASDSSGGKAK